MSVKDKAIELLKDFKGDSYLFGLGVLDNIGSVAASYERRLL